MKSTYSLQILPISFLFLFVSCNPGALHFETRKIGEDGALLSEHIEIDPAKAAIIICDMWDRHWCEGATRRVAEMAPAMNKVITRARKKGITIVHAPSSNMDFYADYPQRKIMETFPEVSSSKDIPGWCYLDTEKESELPIDDTDGGCDTGPQPEHYDVWTRQIAALEIMPEDYISDSGKEINNLFESKGIDHVFLMGVHLNMCVLGRSFGIRSQKRLGRKIFLVRDLTDTMYNPEMPPYVSHEEGTNLMISHVERYWCPSILSSEF